MRNIFLSLTLITLMLLPLTLPYLLPVKSLSIPESRNGLVRQPLTNRQRFVLVCSTMLVLLTNVWYDSDGQAG